MYNYFLKIRVVIVFLFSFYFTSSSQSSYVEIKVECNCAIENNNNLNFIISIKNITSKIVEVPKKYLPVPYRQADNFSDFWFEIDYLDKAVDSTDDLPSSFTHRYGRKKNNTGDSKDRVSINPNEALYFKVSISSYFLHTISGNHKVRFILSGNLFKNASADIFSEWVSFTINEKQ